jgi:hypothetical protein
MAAVLLAAAPAPGQARPALTTGRSIWTTPRSISSDWRSDMAMKHFALVGVGIAWIAPVSAPLANADPASQYVKTPWGTRCQVDANQVTCETCVIGTHFCDPPGSVIMFNTSGVQAPGSFADNLGPRPGIPLSDGPVHADGWTVVMDGGWARFTNDATGHGMALAVQNYYSF